MVPKWKTAHLSSCIRSRSKYRCSYGIRGGLALKSVDCPSRSLEFDSWNPQLPVTPVPGDLVSSFDLLRHCRYMLYGHTFRQTIHIYKIIKRNFYEGTFKILPVSYVYKCFMWKNMKHKHKCMLYWSQSQDICYVYMQIFQNQKKKKT